jgi:hypothetical protein
MSYELWVARSEVVCFAPHITLNYQNEILHYFDTGLANAKAEALNAKNQRFIANNFCIRNCYFFLYGVQLYFSPSAQKRFSQNDYFFIFSS